MPFRLSDSLVLTARLVAERFAGTTSEPDYNRYRSSERLVIGRRRIGLRVRVSPRLSVEGGYLIENRRTV